MKKLMAVMVFFFVIWAGTTLIGRYNWHTFVVISRDSVPVLYIVCDKAVIDSRENAVIVSGITTFGGYGNEDNWLAQKMENRDKNLIIHISDDAIYEFTTGPCFYRQRGIHLDSKSK